MLQSMRRNRRDFTKRKWIMDELDERNKHGKIPLSIIQKRMLLKAARKRLRLQEKETDGKFFGGGIFSCQ